MIVQICEAMFHTVDTLGQVIAVAQMLMEEAQSTRNHQSRQTQTSIYVDWVQLLEHPRLENAVFPPC